MPVNYTAIATGAAANAVTFNNALTELDNAIKKNEYAKTGAPTANDDSNDGYSVGSRWIDVNNDNAYICLDASVGAAVWHRTNIPISGAVNTYATVGVTINQLTNTNEILALMGSDLAHGITTFADTRTFGSFRRYVAANGGLSIWGFSAGTGGIEIRGGHTTDNTTKTTASVGAIDLSARLKSGTSLTACGADANLVTIRNATTTRFIFDAEGSAHADVEWVAFDEHDDMALLNALDAEFARRRNPVQYEFGAWLAENRVLLQKLGIVNFYDESSKRAMLNTTRLQMLLTGALRQLHQRLTILEQHAHA